MKQFRLIITIFCLVLVAGCGGSDSDNLNGSYGVSDISALAKNITIGEGDRVDVYFTSKYEFDGYPDGTDLVLKLPAALAYQLGSSEIFDGSDDARDSRTPDRIVNCDDGTSFIVYNFSDSDLFDREIGGVGSFGIRIQVVGRSVSSIARIEGAAGVPQEYSCDTEFRSEADEAVEVVR